MRFYTQPHQFDGGLDVHARSLYVCILNQAGEVLRHRNMPASPEPFLKAMAPYREDLVVCVECLFTWDWLADLCGREGIPFVLGHALSVTAIHGGKAKHDTIDAQKIAVWLRGGMLPQASVYPAAMRATRDRLRRRMPLMRKRAERLAHIHKTNSQSNLPEMGKKIAYKANRDGVAEQFPALAVQKSIAVDLALIGHSDPWLCDMELAVLKTAKPHDATTRYLRRTLPGIGAILSLVLLDEIHDIQRCPRVQDCVSYGRLVTGAKASAGKRYGTSGTKMGHASLPWAFSDAAVLLLRANPAGQQLLARLEKNHRPGKALTVLAHQWARAVYDMFKRHTAFDLPTCLRGSGEKRASLPPHGPPVGSAWTLCSRMLASLRRRTHRSTSALIPDPAVLIGRPLLRRDLRRSSNPDDVCCPSPEPGTHGRTGHGQPRC
jgi:transposase